MQILETNFCSTRLDEMSFFAGFGRVIRVVPAVGKGIAKIREGALPMFETDGLLAPEYTVADERIVL